MRSSTGTAPAAPATSAGTRSATVHVRRRELGDSSRARSSRVVITADISWAEAEICSRSCRVAGSGTPRSSARSAEPWIDVRGVRSSCASSAVSRCSDRIAEATRSSRWSRVSPSAASSLVGGPRANLEVRSRSLHSAARSAIRATGSSACRVTLSANSAVVAMTSTARMPVA